MNSNFLSFLESRNKFINESFDNSKIDKVFELINKLLKKYIDGLIPLIGYVRIKQGDTELYAKQYMVVSKKSPDNAKVFHINLKQSKGTTDFYSIDFFKDANVLFDEKIKSDLSIYTLGNSISFYLPIIWTVINSNDYNLSEKEALNIARSKFDNVKESKYQIGSLRYIIYENMSQKIINETFNIYANQSIYNSEQTIDEMNIRDYKKKKVDELIDARNHKNDSPEAKDKWKQIVAELKEIDAAIKGGATSIDDLKLAIKHNTQIITELDKETKEAEEKFNAEREDPDLVFKKMDKYTKMVIKGINPSVIICGAPGVGKTYRIKQQLKANGYHEGHNLLTIKGKCTPRMLYLSLMQYKEKGKILLIDDADSLVGPHAPEDCINILKAALDSTSDDEGRIVSYGVSGPLKDDEGVPVEKRFYYNGGIIVITNYQAGSLDSALKGRSFIQDINFTKEELLNIVKKLMPAIDPEHLSAKSKIKAYDYLSELSNNNEDMEISIRTFGICAKIFETAAGDPDFTDDDAKSMIKEQMRLQASKRSGRATKY